MKELILFNKVKKSLKECSSIKSSFSTNENRSLIRGDDILASWSLKFLKLKIFWQSTFSIALFILKKACDP